MRSLQKSFHMPRQNYCQLLKQYLDLI